MCISHTCAILVLSKGIVPMDCQSQPKRRKIIHWSQHQSIQVLTLSMILYLIKVYGIHLFMTAAAPKYITGNTIALFGRKNADYMLSTVCKRMLVDSTLSRSWQLFVGNCHRRTVIWRHKHHSCLSSLCVHKKAAVRTAWSKLGFVNVRKAKLYFGSFVILAFGNVPPTLCSSLFLRPYLP